MQLPTRESESPKKGMGTVMIMQHCMPKSANSSRTLSQFVAWGLCVCMSLKTTGDAVNTYGGVVLAGLGFPLWDPAGIYSAALDMTYQLVSLHRWLRRQRQGAPPAETEGQWRKRQWAPPAHPNSREACARASAWLAKAQLNWLTPQK
jgi:hypothetical protein